MAKQATDMLLVLTNVVGITLRGIPGAGEQSEIQVRTESGDITLRLIPSDDERTLRVMDLRKRDKAKTPRLNVPFLRGNED